MSQGACRTRYGNLPVRQVFCSVHPERPCDPCILCNQGNMSKYFHPKTLRNKSLCEQLKLYEPSLQIMPESCICRLCRDDIDKLSQNGFVPRWRKNKQQTQPTCQIPNCTDNVEKVTKLGTKSQIFHFFGFPNACSSSSDGEETPLCEKHYKDFYKHINPPSYKQCVTCRKYITDSAKVRKCPDASLVQNFLSQNTEFTGVIKEGDIVCYTCYREHLVIVKQSRNTSTDEDLQALLERIKTTMSSVSDIHSLDEALLHATHVCALSVGDALLQQTALLLPNVYDTFCNTLGEISEQQSIALSQDIQGVVSPGWLRSQLSLTLENHMSYRMCIKRYGTLIYRSGGDLLHALTVSLGHNRSKTKKKAELPAEKKNFDQQLIPTCKFINQKVHKCITKLVGEDLECPHNIEDVDIDNFISQLDEDLWAAVCTMTQPLSLKGKRNEESSVLRKIRRVFCVCVLMFTTNSQCSFPLHTLVADAVESCGGSLQLVRLLNRLGACASVETHKRYVQFRVAQRMSRGALSGYPLNTLTVVSIDNLDFVLSFARVFCGKQQSSWHGTTIQFVQPQPSRLGTQDRAFSTTSEQTINETTTISQDERFEGPALPRPSLSDKRSHSSLTPVNSPGRCSPLPKRKRRMRTGVEGAQTIPNIPNYDVIGLQTHCNCNAQQSVPNTQDFEPSPDDNKTLLDKVNMFTQYMLQKVANNDQTSAIIDVKSYLTLLHNYPPPEQSNIIHYKVLNQRCDDKSTLLNVISELHEKFILTQKMNWLLLEGDQATYARLQSIKKEYGKDLEWLIPLPGDWHLLKNFQEVLVKVYFDAGLSDLAKASGYQPNSIGSIFKRTHYFLLETWEAFYRYFLHRFLVQKGHTEFLSFVSNWVNSFPQSLNQENAHRNLSQMLGDIQDKYETFPSDFLTFMETQALSNKTWRFWKQFLLEDCFSYICLYIAIRSGDWTLRVIAIKKMAPLFTAFDRPNYSKLIPRHIHDILTISKDIISLLSRGGFVVSILGRSNKCIGIDEAHEMCINRECKEHVTRPSADYINRIANFLPIRAKAMKNAEEQLFPEKEKKR